MKLNILLPCDLAIFWAFTYELKKFIHRKVCIWIFTVPAFIFFSNKQYVLQQENGSMNWGTLLNIQKEIRSNKHSNRDEEKHFAEWKSCNRYMPCDFMYMLFCKRQTHRGIKLALWFPKFESDRKGCLERGYTGELFSVIGWW